MSSSNLNKNEKRREKKWSQYNPRCNSLYRTRSPVAFIYDRQIDVSMIVSYHRKWRTQAAWEHPDSLNHTKVAPSLSSSPKCLLFEPGLHYKTFIFKLSISWLEFLEERIKNRTETNKITLISRIETELDHVIYNDNPRCIILSFEFFLGPWICTFDTHFEKWRNPSKRSHHCHAFVSHAALNSPTADALNNHISVAFVLTTTGFYWKKPVDYSTSAMADILSLTWNPALPASDRLPFPVNSAPSILC